MQYNVHEAKTHFSRLLVLVSQGESVVIARQGVPVAELVPYGAKGIRLGAGAGDPLVNPAALENDEWCKAMTGTEADDFIEGR